MKKIFIYIWAITLIIFILYNFKSSARALYKGHSELAFTFASLFSIFYFFIHNLLLLVVYFSIKYFFKSYLSEVRLEKIKIIFIAIACLGNMVLISIIKTNCCAMP